jgi:trehalose synthase
MIQPAEVPVERLLTERFQEVLSTEQYERFSHSIAEARELFDGRVVWNVNSTARGGGVAEMLRSLLAYARGAGVDARWLVIEGEPDFFRVTKRIHNHLHGAPGDGGELGEEEKEIYESTLERNLLGLRELVGQDDVVILHDPQTAGLCAQLRQQAQAVIWRCHVGLDTPNALARGAWDFLRPYVAPADAYIFSRRAFAWERLEDERIHVIPPSIDAFSPKNQGLDDATTRSILRATGVMEEGDGANPTFLREDGSPGRVDRQTVFYDGGKPPPPGAPLVVQVSRWDRLKDPLGVIEGFAAHVAPATDAHLVLAGPAVEAVSDDPEGVEVLDEARALWERLDRHTAGRVHLACLPMEDGEENAAIVNALQRRADVVVQKSIAEGFGLTVAEAMWKARPVVATRIGGIQDQISHGSTGWLVDDPHDLASFGDSVANLVLNRELAGRLGDAGQASVREGFLGPRHLMQYVTLLTRLLARRA